MRKRTGALVALTTAASAAAYLFILRPRHLRWGATDEELALPIPGGEFVDDPNYATTRAISINASPQEIWPWLVQMGELPRGGFYSFVTVERLLGMRVRNATAIDPEFQNLEVGQKIDREGNMLVKAFEPEKYLVLGPSDSEELAVRWSLELYPVDGVTRLVSRVRARLRARPSTIAWRIVLDPGQLAMEWRMLREIKRRAEERSAPKVDVALTPPVTVA